MKRLVALMLCAVSLGVTAQLPDYVPTDGLVGWYPLDGDVVDSSPLSNHGAAFGPTPFGNRFGESASSLNFNGIEDYLSIPHSETWEEMPELTISMWVRPDAHPTIIETCGGVTGQRAALMNKWASSNESRTFELMLQSVTSGSNQSPGHLNVCHNAGCYADVGSWDDYPVAVWTHLCVVYGVDSGFVCVNGSVVYSSSALSVSAGMNWEDNEIYIGDFPNAGCNRAFDGQLDDIGTWSRALTLSEIENLYAWTPAQGCMDSAACNYDPEALYDDNSCLYLDPCGVCGGASQAGCADPYACNFDAEAACDDGSCDYSCCPGPGCCTEGMYWDWELSGCYNINPADINLDGCVQLNDLLDLLSAYGDCGAEESAWQCGDPLEYQGHDYATVLIGEQCWFAENLRVENYRNGNAIPTGLSDADWQAAEAGAVAIYQNDESYLMSYGRLYNWYAVDDARGLCSTGWHVPSDEEWTVLTSLLGGESEAGFKMKTTYGWHEAGNGSNESNFSGLPGGLRGNDGSYAGADYVGRWYSSTQNGSVAWNRDLNWDIDGVDRNSSSHTGGFSIRCLKDSE